ncbi:mucin-like protein [Cryptosporidium hominis]
MNTLKLNFISLVLCLAFLSNFLGINDQILSLNTHADLSLIKLSSPRKLLRRLCCCCSSSCSSDDSCCSSSSNSGSLDIGNPTQPKHVWSVTSHYGGFSQEMQTEPPRTQEGNEHNEQSEESEEKPSCCSSGSCKSKELKSNNGGSNGGEDGPQNPYAGYTGRSNLAFTTD